MRYLFRPSPSRRLRVAAAVLLGVLLGAFLAVRDLAHSRECAAPAGDRHPPRLLSI